VVGPLDDRRADGDPQRGGDGGSRSCEGDGDHAADGDGAAGLHRDGELLAEEQRRDRDADERCGGDEDARRAGRHVELRGVE
jgi:hypothetical protein